MSIPRLLIALALLGLLAGCTPFQLYTESVQAAFDPTHHEQVRQQAATQNQELVPQQAAPQTKKRVSQQAAPQRKER